MGVIQDGAAAIAARISSVADTGIVFDHQPLPTNDWATFIETFTAEIAGTRRVRAWTVQYLGETRKETAIAIGQTKQRRDIRYVARAHYGWDDPTSELEFRGHLEAVADAIDAERSIGPAYDHDPVDIDLGEGSGLLLGSVLCHYGELAVTIQVEQTISTS